MTTWELLGVIAWGLLEAFLAVSAVLIILVAARRAVDWWRGR